MSKNQFNILNDWDGVDFFIKESVTISIRTEKGEEVFLEIKTGNYFIQRTPDADGRLKNETK